MQGFCGVGWAGRSAGSARLRRLFMVRTRLLLSLVKRGVASQGVIGQTWSRLCGSVTTGQID